MTADSGYESEEGDKFLKENGQIPYIKPQTYEKWKNAVLRRISANVRTWSIIEKWIIISAMQVNF